MANISSTSNSVQPPYASRQITPISQERKEEIKSVVLQHVSAISRRIITQFSKIAEKILEERYLIKLPNEEPMILSAKKIAYLSDTSKFFNKLFSQQFEERQKKLIKLEMDRKDFEDFILNPDCIVTLENYEKAFDYASFYEIPSLKNKCEVFFKTFIAEAKFNNDDLKIMIEIRELASREYLKGIEVLCESFFTRALRSALINSDESMLELLQSLPIKNLDLSGVPLSPKNIKFLEELQSPGSVQSINLKGQTISEINIAFLKKYDHLSTLDLTECNITEKSLLPLRDLKNSLTSLDLSRASFTPNIFHILTAMDNLKSLTFSKFIFQGGQLNSLSSLPHLESLDLNNCKISENQIREFVLFKQLHTLNIAHCIIQRKEEKKYIRFDELQAEIAKGTPKGKEKIDENEPEVKEVQNNLKILNLTQSNISIEEFEYICHSFPAINSLDLTNTNIKTGLIHLNKLTHLNFLNLSQTNIKDEEIQILVTNNEIRSLDLTMCQISDDGLKYLEDLNLETLILADCILLEGKNFDSLPKSLQVLKLIHCQNIKNENFSNLSHLTKLIYIDLSECGQIEDNTLIFLSVLPSLKLVDLTLCYRITEDGMKQLEGKDIIS